MDKAYRLGALTSAAVVVLAGAAAPAFAQGVPQRPATPAASPPSISQPVVQPIPGKNGRTLDAALGRLARDPRDIEALIDAGNAALVMGDVDAATGFFRRADQVSPGNPRVKAGLAGAMVHSGDPFGAIPLFDEAEKAGALDGTLAADRGLAYDLVGDNVTAQRFYRQAQARAPSDEVVRRLALSLAISGDKQGAEQILSPLLQQRNLAAWRTRAFALAILGQTEEAVGVANTILPAELAGSVAPYLRYMPRLTRAQQAAAANFGAFPRASEIGRDDPRVAQYAPQRATVAAADAALTPQGEPLGRNTRSRDRRSARAESAARTPTPTTSRSRAARVAPPEPQPAREVVAVAPVSAPAPAPAPAPASLVAQAPRPAPTPAPAPAPRTAAVSLPPAAQAPARTTAQPRANAPAPALAAVPGPALAAASPAVAAPVQAAATARPPAPATQPLSAAPAPAAPAPVAAAVRPRSLAEIFAEFERPSTDATPAAGAVDLRRITPARPKPPEAKPAEASKPAEAKPAAAPKPPPPPSHPSRIWVQVATGRDKAALGYDWRRMTREKAEAFRGKQPFLSAWGRTNRLLTGPFQSEAAANSFIAQLRRADVDGAFVWTSPAGQVVDALPGTAPRR